MAAVIISFGIWKKQHNNYSWRRVCSLALIPLLGLLLSTLPIKTGSIDDVTGSTDVLFVVDITYSMNARDSTHQGRQLSRLEHAQAHIQEIGQSLVGSRMAILAIDNGTSLYLPMTTSERDLRIAAQTLFTKSSYQAILEPNLTGGLQEADSYLERQREVDDTRRQVVIFMSDGELSSGEDSNESMRTAMQELLSGVHGGMVIGYGDTKGATIPNVNFDSFDSELENTGYNVRDPDSSDDAITKRNDALLEELGALDKSSTSIANDSPDVAAQAEALRQEAGTRPLNNGTTRALNQNILHVPFAMTAMLWLVALEVWSVPALRNQLARKWGRKS
ncbi:MAG: VWA domain-containing protein [Actinomycetia bacterium]|nr:VWA domain-containing protein [Actinomycetes bacterium]